jgi:ATP-dependent Clp protease ATP-binding subunit ClpC
MANKFSKQVKEIISLSREEAECLRNDFIGTEHLLLALIREGDNEAIQILKTFNVDLLYLKHQLKIIGNNNGPPLNNSISFTLNNKAEAAIRSMVSEAGALESSKIEVEHLLPAILKNGDDTVYRILNESNVRYKETALMVRNKLTSI